ncbi:hypothetical protein B0H17DRAFT_1195127 [Mycena rosella]|uniref:Uncharacterized protein n=1 Tax=Mycena rosella TaxID=1033263 RepID=A0AAD7DZX3_MYCRO|nr:hypothetical protein B0H17DRAFT_1195127 [Mycena rosella]
MAAPFAVWLVYALVISYIAHQLAGPLISHYGIPWVQQSLQHLTWLLIAASLNNYLEGVSLPKIDKRLLVLCSAFFLALLTVCIAFRAVFSFLAALSRAKRVFWRRAVKTIRRRALLSRVRSLSFSAGLTILVANSAAAEHCPRISPRLAALCFGVSALFCSPSLWSSARLRGPSLWSSATRFGSCIYNANRQVLNVCRTNVLRTSEHLRLLAFVLGCITGRLKIAAYELLLIPALSYCRSLQEDTKTLVHSPTAEQTTHTKPTVKARRRHRSDFSGRRGWSFIFKLAVPAMSVAIYLDDEHQRNGLPISRLELLLFFASFWFFCGTFVYGIIAVCRGMSGVQACPLPADATEVPDAARVAKGKGRIVDDESDTAPDLELAAPRPPTPTSPSSQLRAVYHAMRDASERDEWDYEEEEEFQTRAPLTRHRGERSGVAL